VVIFRNDRCIKILLELALFTIIKTKSEQYCHAIMIFKITSVAYQKKDRHYFHIIQSTERRVCVAINYRSAMQPSYLGCWFRTGSASRMCGFDISQTFRQTRICILCICACTHVHECLSLCARTVASGIYMDSLSHYARHFCSSYRKQYSPTVSILRILHPLSLSLSLSLSLIFLSRFPGR